VRFVGALLATALVLAPAAAARMSAVSMRGAFWLAVGLGLASSVIGLYVSFQFEIAAGAAIVLTAIVGFFVCAVVGRVRKGA